MWWIVSLLVAVLFLAIVMFVVIFVIACFMWLSDQFGKLSVRVSTKLYNRRHFKEIEKARRDFD